MSMLVALPREGTEVTHVPSGKKGIVGKWDLRHNSGRPYVRLDYQDKLYDWVPAEDCTWEGNPLCGRT